MEQQKVLSSPFSHKTWSCNLGPMTFLGSFLLLRKHYNTRTTQKPGGRVGGNTVGIAAKATNTQ